MKPRILIDVDGVFADFLTPCLDAVHAVTGRRHSPNEVSEWDIMKALGIDEETGRKVYKSMEVPGLCASIPAYDGAREGVERLRSWAEVWAVTSPFGGEHWMHERDAWLVKNMGFVKRDVLHVRGERKHGVYGHALVEDKVATLRAWRDAWPAQLPVLLERYSNANDGWDGCAARDWPHLVEVLEDQLRR
jgi:5'(3')-deoxyribonucleotidase